MSLGHFLRIERDEREGSRNYVVHLGEPKFSMELAVEGDGSGRPAGGVIKRVCVPNSWAGDYGQYAKLIGAAQEFFVKSFEESAGRKQLRRFGR
jgi:hypothetical protein